MLFGSSNILESMIIYHSPVWVIVLAEIYNVDRIGLCYSHWKYEMKMLLISLIALLIISKQLIALLNSSY